MYGNDNNNNNTSQKNLHFRNFAIIAAATAGAMWAIPALGRSIGSGWDEKEGLTNKSYGRLPGQGNQDDEDCGCGG